MITVKNDPLALLREEVFYIAQPFLQTHTAIIDVNPNNGDMIAPFVEACPDDQRFCLFGPPLSRFKDPRMIYADCDFMRKYSYENDYISFDASLVIASFIMRKIPLHKTVERYEALYDLTRNGGACIVIDYVQAGTRKIQNAMQTRDRDDITPNDVLFRSSWIEHFMIDAGFIGVECFFRMKDIVAYIGLKDGE